MNSETFEALAGVKVVTLVCAFIGAALGISYTPQVTPRLAIGALVAGIVCGGFGPGLIEWGFGLELPLVISQMVAVVFGIGGIFIIPGIITGWQELIRDPVGFVGKLRNIFSGTKGGDK